MKTITIIFWVIFVCFAPFFAIPALYLIAMSAILWLLLQVFVLFCQGALKLAGKMIQKAEVYWKNRPVKQIEEIKQIEGAKL